MPRSMTPNEFIDSLHKAETGEEIIYHIGCLAYDRDIAARQTRESALIETCATMAWKVAAPQLFEIGSKADHLSCAGWGIATMAQRKIPVRPLENPTYAYLIRMKRSLTIEEADHLRAFGLKLRDHNLAVWKSIKASPTGKAA